MSLRETGRRLRVMQQGDLPTKGGRTLAYVYDSGRAEVDALGREALAAFSDSNGLDPTAFPSLMQMENDLVGLAADLLDGPPGTVGTVTSGGTESVLLAVQAARDSRPDLARGNLVMPTTAHPSFLKAAHYFGLGVRAVPVGPDLRADPVATAAALDDDTVLVVASAPSYPHGVIDPVAAIASLAQERGLRCHVDACIGGWVLPFARELGREVPDWTFAVPGVTSISVDLHKYAYTPKGASILLHRSPDGRRPQFFASAAWPGYTMLNSTMQSTKSGGPLAAAWTVVHALGHDGYLALVGRTLAGVDRLVAGVAEVDGVYVVAAPDSTLVALACDDSCDVFTLADELALCGWFAQPQMAFVGLPATLHLTMSAATADHVEEFLEELAKAVARARALGPVRIDPDLAALAAQLDPATLAPGDLEAVLVTAGLLSDDRVTVPRRLAGVNALLDAASPALREAVHIAFLDHLARPVRGADW